MFSTHAGEFGNFFCLQILIRKCLEAVNLVCDPYLDLRLGVVLEKSKADNISS